MQWYLGHLGCDFAGDCACRLSRCQVSGSMCWCYWSAAGCAISLGDQPGALGLLAGLISLASLALAVFS